MGALFGGIGGFFCFAGVVLLIVVSCSTPVWTKVYFLAADLPAGSLRFGIWGACIVPSTGGSTCTPRELGYRVEDIIANASGDLGGTASNAIIHGLTYALILHPIAASIGFIAFLLALCANIFTHILGSLVAGLAFIIAAIAFGFDLGIFITARHRFRESGISASLDNATWLTLVAMICFLIGFFTVCFSGLRHRREKRYNDMMAEPAYESNYDEKVNVPFWRRNRRTAAI